MNCPILPKRVFNSPLIEYANFKDGNHVNLIRLNKPYANGAKNAVHVTNNNPLCSNGLFKTYDKAKKMFELMVIVRGHESELSNRGLTGN